MRGRRKRISGRNTRSDTT
jgi:hypothetical protein